MSQLSDDKPRKPSFGQQLAYLKTKQTELVNTFVRDIDVMEERLCKNVQELGSNLKKCFLKQTVEDNEKSFELVAAQTTEVKKLKLMIQNMDKLISDFRKTSSKMFEAAESPESEDEAESEFHYAEEEDEMLGGGERVEEDYEGEDEEEKS
jgi:RNA processing factor Prp31